jgi:hypothetical protein
MECCAKTVIVNEAIGSEVATSGRTPPFCNLSANRPHSEANAQIIKRMAGLCANE